MVTFADEVKVETDGFTSDQERLREAIAAIETRGKITELFKALYKSLQLLKDPGLPGRKRLVVVSGGKDEGEAYTLDDVLVEARKLRVPVDSVGLTRIDPKYLSQLERLADLSGGTYDRASRASDLERLFEEGMERIDATPVATFEIERLTADEDLHRLGVRWDAEGQLRQGETQVRLSPPSPTPAAPGPGADGDSEKRSGDRENEEAGLAAWLPAAAGAALLALLVLWLFLRRRRRKPAAIDHDDELLQVVEHLGDVWVPQLRLGLGLDEETLPEPAFTLDQRRHQLHRRRRLEHLVVGEIHRAHPARAELRLQHPVADHRALHHPRFYPRSDPTVGPDGRDRPLSQHRSPPSRASPSYRATPDESGFQSRPSESSRL